MYNHNINCWTTSFTLLTEIQGYSTFVDVPNKTNRSSTNDGQTNEGETATDGDALR